MGGKSRIDRDRQVMKPELGFGITRPDMDMRRFSAFVRIKERTIGSPAQDSWHSQLPPHKLVPSIPLRIEQRGEVAVIDPCRGRRGDGRFGVVGDP